MLPAFCQNQRCPFLFHTVRDIFYNLLIPELALNNKFVGIIYFHHGSIHMCQVCESRIDEMSNSLFLCPVFGCIPITNRPKLHKNLFLLSVIALWRGGQTVHIFCVYFVQHFLRCLRSAVMTFIHNNHTIIFHQIINIALFAQ